MTTVFDIYLANISSGIINLSDVDFGVLVIKQEYYTPQPNDSYPNDTAVEIPRYEHVLMGSDIAELTMSGIVEKIKGVVPEELLNEDVNFVVFDHATRNLCFSEPINKME